LFEESHFGRFLPLFGLKKGYFDAFYPVLNSRWAPTWAPPTIVVFFAHYTHKPTVDKLKPQTDNHFSRRSGQNGPQNGPKKGHFQRNTLEGSKVARSDHEAKPKWTTPIYIPRGLDS
jgi:hypothetical protein